MNFSQNHKIVIIAEAGVNHNGSLRLAMEMVEKAAEAGADYVKFQTFRSENLVTSKGVAADYQKRNCNADSQLDMLRKLELSFESFVLLSDYCKKCGIGFLSTPFDRESIDFLADLGMDYMKVPSGEITNLPYLRAVAQTHIPVIISTGMCSYSEIEDALDVFYAGGYAKEEITLLHCNTEYPTPYDDVNLRAMASMHYRFGVATGYSDHTRGIEVPVAAAALGASVVEKHFTLSRSLEGPDHVSSLEPDELVGMVKSIRNVIVALGSDKKFVTESERKNIAVARKSIVAACDIKQGELFSENNLTAKRPGTGLSPMRWDEVIGRKAIKDFRRDELIVI